MKTGQNNIPQFKAKDRPWIQNVFQLIFSKFKTFIPSIYRIINWQCKSKGRVPGENLRLLNICQSSWNFLAPKREQAAICFSGTKSLLNLCILGRSYASWLSLPFSIRGIKKKHNQKNPPKKNQTSNSWQYLPLHLLLITTI